MPTLQMRKLSLGEERPSQGHSEHRALRGQRCLCHQPHPEPRVSGSSDPRTRRPKASLLETEGVHGSLTGCRRCRAPTGLPPGPGGLALSIASIHVPGPDRGQAPCRSLSPTSLSAGLGLTGDPELPKVEGAPGSCLGARKREATGMPS